MDMSRDQFAWFQENAREELALARTQADRLFQQQERAYASDQEARAFAQRVGQTQMDAMDLQMDYARRDRARFESVFQPMQDRFIREAEAYDTPERREAEAARAMVDIQRQVEAQRTNADQRLRSMGIDPSQVRSTSMANQMGVVTAANQALAGNNARTMIEDKGRALRADALNLGMGLPAQAAAGFAGAGNSGAGAMNAAAAGQGATLGAIQGGAGVAGTAMGFRSGALNNVAALTGSPMQWASMSGNMMGTALSGYGQAANTINSGYQNQMQHWRAGQEQAQQQFNNVMSVASMAGGMMMAEGGSVGEHRKRYMMGGGLAGVIGSLGAGATKAAASGEAKPRWIDKMRAKHAEDDAYIRAGAGRGEGGALNWQDRVDNGMTAAGSYAPTNVFEGEFERLPPMPVAPLPEFRAEGGSVGGRALPVQQSRDRHNVMLSDGEYVIPSDVVRSKGIEFFDKLISKYHREGA